jgi:hypothetical protein
MSKRCQVCGHDASLDEHHIVPRRYGGSDRDENLVTLCANCHRAIEEIYDDRFYRALGVGKESESRKNPMEFQPVNDESELYFQRVYAIQFEDSARLLRLIRVLDTEQGDDSDDESIGALAGTSPLDEVLDEDSKSFDFGSDGNDEGDSDQSDSTERYIDKYGDLTYQFRSEISIQRGANIETKPLDPRNPSESLSERVTNTDRYIERIGTTPITYSTERMAEMIDEGEIYSVKFDGKLSDYLQPHEIYNGYVMGSALRRISNFADIGPYSGTE